MWSVLPLSAFLVGASESLPRLKYLALGDSYTIGEGVVVQDRWPHQCVRKLAEKQLSFAEPEYVAKTGWTTRELLHAIRAHEDLLSQYDLVTLMIGVNNQYRGESVFNYERELSALIRVAVRLTGMRAGRVIVPSIPYWCVTPFAQNDSRALGALRQTLDEFNQVAETVANSFGVRFVSLTDLTLTQHQPQDLVDDALHYSAKSYERWSERLSAAMLEALKPTSMMPDRVD